MNRFSMMIALLVVSLLAPVSAAHADPHRPLGDSRVLARVPTPPGWPEGIAVQDNRVYVCGPAEFGNVQPSKVLAYDLDSHALVREYPVQGQDFSREHALVGCVFHEKGLLYVVDTQQGVIRYDVNGPGPEQVYAPLVPDLPTCSTVAPGTACSPTAVDRPPLPNDLTFDKAGNLYLTDSFQATIWRIPPGGGKPQIWFQDSRLDIDYGPNGVRIDPKGERLYFAASLDSLGQGFIYSLPLVAQPAAADLTIFHEYPGQGPDGITFGKSGKLYVALVLPSQISVLRPDGTEEARYSGPAADPSNPTQPLPWANPANSAFNDKTGALLVTNHAPFFPNPPDYFAVVDVFVDDKAAE